MKMEGAKFEEVNSVLKVPIGFRFEPTDEELVVHYLKRKVLSLPLPVDVIPELDVFQLNSWDLPGALEERRHFFCRKLRTSGWRRCKKEMEIVANKVVVGMKRCHVLKQKPEWVVEEFCCVSSTHGHWSIKRAVVQVGDWVVCRVYQRRRRSRSYVKKKKKKSDVEVGFSSSPSTCSGVTEISTMHMDQEAVTSPH